MMHGYDKDAAVAFITRCIRKADHPELAEDIPALVPQMIDADMAYMHEAGVLDDDGYAGAALVDDYLDAQQMFLESQGMVEYEE